MAIPQTLLDDYNEWRKSTAHVFKLRQQGRYVSNLKLTDERKATLQKMLEFCKEHQAEPRLWMYSLFQRRRWLFAPRMEHLCSEKHIEYYRHLPEAVEFKRKIQRELHERRTQEGHGFDPNRDISPSIESAKRRFLELASAQDCLAASTTKTYGYHPKSEICQACPLARECETSLVSQVGFDITALRRGELTVEQARNRAMLKVANAR